MHPWQVNFLGLARAYAVEAADPKVPPNAQQDLRSKARSSYQDFLTLWKEGDPDNPVLKQAKQEYAKL